jgi:hypothetical protein
MQLRTIHPSLHASAFCVVAAMSAACSTPSHQQIQSGGSESSSSSQASEPADDTSPLQHPVSPPRASMTSQTLAATLVGQLPLPAANSKTSHFGLDPHPLALALNRLASRPSNSLAEMFAATPSSAQVNEQIYNSLHVLKTKPIAQRFISTAAIDKISTLQGSFAETGSNQKLDELFAIDVFADPPAADSSRGESPMHFVRLQSDFRLLCHAPAAKTKKKNTETWIEIEGLDVTESPNFVSGQRTLLRHPAGDVVVVTPHPGQLDATKPEAAWQWAQDVATGAIRGTEVWQEKAEVQRRVLRLPAGISQLYLDSTDVEKAARATDPTIDLGGVSIDHLIRLQMGGPCEPPRASNVDEEEDVWGGLGPNAMEIPDPIWQGLGIEPTTKKSTHRPLTIEAPYVLILTQPRSTAMRALFIVQGKGSGASTAHERSRRPA